MKIELGGFSGEVPFFEAHSLPNNAATLAKNCIIGNGEIRALKNVTTSAVLTRAGTIRTIHRYGTGHWFSFLKRSSVVTLPITGDTVEKTIITTDDGSVGPKITDATIATSGGGTDYPTNSRDLGVPAPASAPTCSPVGTAPETTDVQENRYYLVTYVNGYGWEGPPSPVSSEIIIGPAQFVRLTGLPTAPNGNYNVTHIRIYRSSAGNSTSEFRFVTEIPVGTSSYDDEVDAEGLAEVIQTADYDLPPSNLAGVTLLPCNVLVGWAGKTLCFSEPGQFQAWPIKYRREMSYVPNGIGVFGTSFVVLGAGLPVVFTGDDPANMTQEKVENGHPCINGAGIVDLGYAIAYPSHEGLRLIGVGMNKNVTEKLFTPLQWKALTPETFVSALYRNSYIAFMANGESMIIDMATGALTFSSISGSAVFTDRAAGKLYLAQGQNVTEWDSGSELSYTWQSKPFQIPVPSSFTVFQVRANQYPVTLKVRQEALRGEAAQEETIVVTSSTPGRLPLRGHLSDEIKITISGTGKPFKVVLATNHLSLKST